MLNEEYPQIKIFSTGPKLTLEEKLEVLLNFGKIVEKKPEYQKIYELMITGYCIKNPNMPRKYVIDTLYYMNKK